MKSCVHGHRRSRVAERYNAKTDVYVVAGTLAVLDEGSVAPVGGPCALAGAPGANSEQSSIDPSRRGFDMEVWDKKARPVPSAGQGRRAVGAAITSGNAMSPGRSSLHAGGRAV